MFNFLKITGKGIAYLGMGCVFVMAIIGTISIDIVLIAWLAKESSRHGNNGFLTGFLWGTLFSNRNSGSLYGNAGIMLAISPFTTAIAIGLSLLVGVPGVGLALIIGWGISAGLVGLGLAIYGIANALEQPTAEAVKSIRFGVSNSYASRSGYGSSSQMTQQQNSTATNPCSQDNATYGSFFSSASPQYDTPPAYTPYATLSGMQS